MHTFQPYLHFKKTGEFSFNLQALVAIPDDWAYDNTVEVINHPIEGERLFFIMVKPMEGNVIDGSLQVSYPFTIESGTNDKIMVEVVHFTSGANHDVLGHFAAFPGDSSEDNMADRTVEGGGKKDVNPAVQIIRDPV